MSYEHLSDAEFDALPNCMCGHFEWCEKCEERIRRSNERFKKALASGKVDFGASIAISRDQLVGHHNTWESFIKSMHNSYDDTLVEVARAYDLKRKLMSP